LGKFLNFFLYLFVPKGCLCLGVFVGLGLLLRLVGFIGLSLVWLAVGSWSFFHGCLLFGGDMMLFMGGSLGEPPVSGSERGMILVLSGSPSTHWRPVDVFLGKRHDGSKKDTVCRGCGFYEKALVWLDSC
jgi:hypothetical protein